MKKSWADYLEKLLFIITPLTFLASIFYMVWFIAADRAPLIPHDDVTVISDWTYIDQMTGPETIHTPVRVDEGGRDTFVFETKLPEHLPDGCVIAFLNKADMTIEVNDKEIRRWKRSEASIMGGPAKNSYFVTPLSQDCAGGELCVTLTGMGFSGRFFDAFVGERYEVVRFLEIKSGAFQFVMSLALLICSLAIIIAGFVLKFIYKQNIKLILMAIGIFIVSSWMVVDSFVFQFLFRTQYIDGLMSYMTTLCIVFPFLSYLDAIQDHRYKKWYAIFGVVGAVNLYGFSILHFTKTVNFSDSLLYVDLMVAIVTVGAFVVTVYDIVKGNAKQYRYVAYGFLAFMVLAIVEMILINTAVERIEGGVMIAGLYIMFAFAIVQQLYEIRQIQIERDRANEEGIAKTMFLTSISHEIRTPINSILGMNEMIQQKSNDPAITEYAEIISESGNMLLSLINDVLDFSKIGNDMEEIVMENYDPEKMIDKAATMLETLAARKGLAVKVGKPRNLPPQLYGDEKRLSQIVINLITNAVKYTDEGTVTFTGECFKNGDRFVLCFYVSDTGIGIKSEDIDGIFDPFKRSDLGKNQSIQGTGLGLSIVKRLVEKMDGEIKVESVYGKGSTFSVRIPQMKAKTTPEEKYNPGNAVEDDELDDIDENYIAPEARILEVDDNTANQIVVREFLKDTGVQLDIVSDGKSAIRMCKVNKYDCILMDHMMPDPDGIATMHAIKNDESGVNVDTPQIILTANAIMGSRAMYEAEGFDNYLSKPVDSVRLKKMIRKYLPADKVLYKPKKRSKPVVEKSVPSDGPVDIAELISRFDNNENTAKVILEAVYNEGQEKIPLLRQLVEEGDMKRYGIEAHGVKGSMAGACADGLSAIAKQHELAAKGGDVGFVKDNLEDFLDKYGEVIEYIRKYLNEENSSN